MYVRREIIEILEKVGLTTVLEYGAMNVRQAELTQASRFLEEAKKSINWDNGTETALIVNRYLSDASADAISESERVRERMRALIPNLAHGGHDAIANFHAEYPRAKD